MNGYINGKNWVEVEPMKYWSMSVNTPIETRKQTVRNAIFSNEYMGALKVDGYYQRFIKDEDGNCFMIARSRNVKGEVVNKIEWVPHLNEWMNSLPNGTCLLCECYLPGKEGSYNVTSILGCLKEKAIKRQEKSPLHLYVFDCMAFDGTNYNKTPYVSRASMISQMAQKFKSPYIEYAEYYEGKELWDKLQEYLASGREGCVIMRKDALVYEKRTPARVSIKVKKELTDTIDAFILNANAPTRIYAGKDIETWKYWEDIRTGEKLEGEFYNDYFNGRGIEPVTKHYFHTWAGSLNIAVYDGEKIIPIGAISGLTEEVLSNWRDYIGKVVEVGGMQMLYDANGNFSGIRHPRVMSWRTDKKPSECTFEQLK